MRNRFSFNLSFLLRSDCSLQEKFWNVFLYFPTVLVHRRHVIINNSVLKIPKNWGEHDAMVRDEKRNLNKKKKEKKKTIR